MTLVAATSLAVLAACGGGGGESSKPTCSVSGVTVSPTTAALVVGGTQQLNAAVSATNCTPVPTASWSSSSPSVASVNASGFVTAVGEGTTTISASAAGASGSATITVSPPPIATIEISPANASVITGKTVTLTATAKDAQGATLSGRTITWSSLTPTFASVAQGGVVTGISAGAATITASAEGKVAVTVVTVTPPPVATVSVVLNSPTLAPGEQTQVTYTPRDADGAPLSGRAGTLSSSNGAVASVSQAGVVTAIAPGTTDIIATVEGKTGSATLTVTQVPVATMTLTLTKPTMSIGEVQAASAATLDQSGNVLTGRTISFSSSAPAVASISSTGLITALSAGTTVITATSEGKFAVASLVVSPAVASIQLTLASSSIVAGQTTQATATAKDAQGNALPGITITFASTNTSVATVNSAGVVTGVAAGTASITATSGAVTQAAVLTVTPVIVPVASVTMSPSAGSVDVGATLQLTATPRDAGGTALTGRAINWTTSNSSLATVSAAGAVTGVSAGGPVTITATVEGKSATASITVTPVIVPVASVTVAFANTNPFVGDVYTATATAKSSSGTVISGLPASWTSNNTAVATVNSAGQVTAVAPGTATITATVSGVNGSLATTINLTLENRRLAYAWIDGLTTPLNTPFTPATSYSLNVTGGSVSATRTGTGLYSVTFGRLSKSPSASFRENVFVSSYGAKGENCSVLNWGNTSAVDLTVFLECRSLTTGTLVNSRFTIAVIGSNTLADANGFLWNPTATASSPAEASYAFSSQGGSQSNSRNGVGTYLAQLGLNTTAPSTALATAYGPGTGCQVSNWSSFNGWVSLNCTQVNTSNSVDSRYNVILLKGGRAGARWGFAWNDQVKPALNSQYTPSLGSQKQSNGQQVTMIRVGTGEYQVVFPGLNRTSSAQRETFLTTAYGGAFATHCQINGWATFGVAQVATVYCWDRNTRLPTNSEFTIFMLS